MTKTINTVMSNDILNFTLTCKGLVRAYSRGYKLVTTESHTVAHNSEQALYHAALNDAYITHLKIYKVDRGANHKSLCTYDIAIQNMLRDVRSLSLCNVLTNIYQVCADSKGYDDTDDISDDDICYQPIIPHYDELKIFTNLKKIRALNNVNLPDYAIPNFDSLVEVCIPCADEYINHHITTHTNKDIALSPCTRIRVLNVSGNPIITTCDPFAASLRILYAERHCGISDKSLERCKRIKLLSASNNPHITTCIPFATSLVKLSAGGECGVGDTGIHLCIRLKYLRATNNANITVYDSFKKYSQNTIRKSYTCSEQ